MSISVNVSLLVLLAVCLNLKSSASANSLAATHTDQNDSNVSVDINVVGIIISNDLPPSPNKLLLFTDFQKNQVEIRRGDPYTRLLSMDDHTGQLRWKQCLDFSYIPGLEKGHQRVFWSAREDGLYHSWDNKIWDKREDWGPC